MTNLQFSVSYTPLGPILLCADNTNLRTVCWHSASFNPTEHEDWAVQETLYFGTVAKSDSIIVQADKQLREYFQGARSAFDIPLCQNQGSEFQQGVWRALEEIPYGKTCSYAELAQRLSNPQGSRAVGGACRANPISIFTPCHRVIGSDGKLVGFGGGHQRKEILLALEAA